MGKASKCFTLFVVVLSLFFPWAHVKAEDNNVMQLTLQDAVRIGLENSVALKQVQNQVDLSDLALDRAKYQSKKLKEADEELDTGKEQLNAIESAINQGVLPPGITLPDGTVVTEPTPVSELPLDDETKEKIISSIKAEIESGKAAIESGESAIDAALQEAGAEFSDKLDFQSLKSLDIDSTRDMMTTMAEVSKEVTAASYGIYKNQIALLIQKDYYDVLKAQRMLDVKRKALDRAQKQYELAKAGYEEGMKAKDDMLLAELYYQKTRIEYEQAVGELNNSMTALKADMNVSQDTPVQLTDVLVENVEGQDLAEGLKSGLTKRLEIKKTFGQVIVYNLNFDVAAKTYPPNTFQYKEAALLKQKAQLEYDNTRTAVESSIRQSYENMVRAGEMLKQSAEMVAKAAEVVEIANYKYNEGYGQDNSLLKQLNLEDSAGTIVEVLAAEENLAGVEEKVVEITYGYNLARMKYLNDICRFTY